MARFPTVLALALTMSVPGACRLAVIEPEPLAGPVPAVIAVWPVAVTDSGAAADVLLSGLGMAVRGRGYAVVSTAVGRELLVGADLLPPDGVPRRLAAIGQALSADAVMVLDVRAFESRPTSVGGLAEARWDLGWRLLSTRGGGVLWSHVHHGLWRNSDGGGFDPLRRLDALPEIVPIGGDGRWHFGSVRELAAGLHRLAMEHLPRR